MEVLFVSSGNKKNGISPIVANQGQSLELNGCKITYFTVNGNGFIGYLKSFPKLMQYVIKYKFDIIHAHYSLCGFLVTPLFLFNRNIIVSLMGTIKRGGFKYYLLRLFSLFFWKAIIVKSERMKQQLGIERAVIIPNGVETTKFINSIEKKETRSKLQLPEDKKIVLFLADPDRSEKNYSLAKKMSKKLPDNHILLPVFGKPHDLVINYLTAADVLLLTSFTEGSPNVIKEAMAAGCPIVTTNVGDVAYLLRGVTGSFVMDSYDIDEGVLLLRKALAFEGKTNGLKRIEMLKIDAKSTAEHIISIYKNDT